MIDYIATILETIFFLIASAGFLSQKINKTRLLISLAPICVFKAIFLFLPATTQMEALSSFINILLGIVSIMILTKSGFKTSLSCYITGYIFAMLFQLALVGLISFFGDFVDSDWFIIFGSVYTVIIAIIAYRFFRIDRIFSLLFEKSKLGLILITNMFALAFIMALYFKLDKSQFIDVVLFVLITFFILVCMNLVLFNQFKKINIQSAQLTAYEQYLPVLDSLIQNVRIKQHNHANELQSIIGLMHTYKDYESLTREMNKYINISQTLSQPDFLLKLNMPLVAGFLYHKKLEASKTGINLEYIINSYNLSSIVPEYELIELMGILIDNAVDAVKPDSIIHIGLDTVDGKIKFTTRNAGHIITQRERDMMFTKGYSTKHSGKHSGLGLYQLKNIVLKQYNGIIAVWNEGTDILFEITV